MFDRIVESIIKDAMERGEFDNLSGQGKPIDLTEYFETPEEVRLVNSVLKNAGMTSREVDLLKDWGRGASTTTTSAPRARSTLAVERIPPSR